MLFIFNVQAATFGPRLGDVFVTIKVEVEIDNFPTPRVSKYHY